MGRHAKVEIKLDALEALKNLIEYKASIVSLSHLIESYKTELEMKHEGWSEDKIAECKDRIKRYNLWRSYTESRVKAIENALSALNNEERMILQYMIIDRNRTSVEFLKNELNVKTSVLYVKYKKALTKFEHSLLGVPMPEEVPNKNGGGHCEM